VSAKKATVGFAILFFAAVAALVGYWLLSVWLPKRVGAAITERFGDYVTIGEVRYVFPLAVDVRDVVFVKRPRSFLSGEAARVRVKLRPSAVLLLRFDARLWQEISTEDYTIYLYPLRVLRLRLRKPTEGTPEEISKTTEPPVARPPAGVRPQPGWVASSASEPGRGGERKGRVAKARPFDFEFRAKRGRVVFRGDRGDAIILREADVEGRVSAEGLKTSLDAVTAGGKAFAFSAAYSFLEEAGSAEYRAEALGAADVLSFAGKPGYLLGAEGVLTFEGTFTWRGGKLDHRATGRLSKGRVVLAPGNVRVSLEDVDFQFTLHNADLAVDEGSCRAAKARWHFGGRATETSLDITFRSENMTFQNLVDMFVGEVAVRFAGVGIAELRIFGTPREPEFYIHVERTDK
jgi:hypothetical protein